MPDTSDVQQHIPRRRVPPLRIPGATAGAAAAAPPGASGQQLEQPTALDAAHDDPGLFSGLSSPLASSQAGRSLSSILQPKPMLEADVQQARLEEDAAAASGGWWAGAAREARTLSRLALPTCVANLAGFCISLVVLAVAGRLGPFELSCIVLGTSIYNVTGLSLLMGAASRRLLAELFPAAMFSSTRSWFTAVMETLCGQAYGARNFRMVGIVFQRALFLTTVLATLVALGWLYAEDLLLLFRQDPLLSRSAARFIRLTIPALWATGVFEASKRYLLAQGVVRPQSAATLVGLALAPLYSWLFIFKLDWRLDGAAVAFNAIQVTMAAMLGLYIVARDTWQLRGLPHATWRGWSADALRGWAAYLRLALPSVAMLCVEWWTFEAMILMSGWLEKPEVAVAVMGICINSSGIIWMFVSGYALACSTRVSNSLGAGCPRTAQRATWTAVGITSAVEVTAAAAIVAARTQWPHLFTDAPDVVALTASLLPIFALSLPGDGANAVLQGLLRGAGRQATGAVTNCFSYWLIGIPSAAYLAFGKHMGVHGLWWGLVIVNTVQGTVMALLAWRMDFGAEARKALARTAAAQPEGLQEPLLQGTQCERLERGMLLPYSEEEFVAAAAAAAGAVPAADGRADGPADVGHR